MLLLQVLSKGSDKVEKNMGVGNKVLEMVLQNHKNIVTLINFKCFTLLPSFPQGFLDESVKNIQLQWQREKSACSVKRVTMNFCVGKCMSWVVKD
jgi:hypothetical protein